MHSQQRNWARGGGGLEGFLTAQRKKSSSVEAEREFKPPAKTDIVLPTTAASSSPAIPGGSCVATKYGNTRS